HLEEGRLATQSGVLTGTSRCCKAGRQSLSGVFSPSQRWRKAAISTVQVSPSLRQLHLSPEWVSTSERAAEACQDRSRKDQAASPSPRKSEDAHHSPKGRWVVRLFLCRGRPCGTTSVRQSSGCRPGA